MAYNNEAMINVATSKRYAKVSLVKPVVKQVPIEVKWNLPAWMMRNPGPRVRGEYSYK